MGIPAPCLHTLDTAWRIVDAEGGAFEAGDTLGTKRARLIKTACDAIEALGGMDPAQRAQLAAGNHQQRSAA